jgi:hypothetical protein
MIVRPLPVPTSIVNMYLEFITTSDSMVYSSGALSKTSCVRPPLPEGHQTGGDTAFHTVLEGSRWV